MAARTPRQLAMLGIGTRKVVTHGPVAGHGDDLTVVQDQPRVSSPMMPTATRASTASTRLAPPARSRPTSGSMPEARLET